MILFQSTKGRVIAIEEGEPAQFAQYSISPTIEYKVDNAIVTQIAVGEQTNVQFLHTIGGRVYIYAFGDKMGQLGVSGIGFEMTCDNLDNSSGIENMYKWYQRNNVTRRFNPITFSIGKVSISAFLVTFNASIVDTNTGLQQWSLGLSTIQGA